MTKEEREAVKLVMRSATAHAGDHEHCLKIHEAIRVVTKLIDRKVRADQEVMDFFEGSK